MSVRSSLRLVGAGGEQVSLVRTLQSHGLATLPPAEVEDDGSTATFVVRVPRARPRVVQVRSSGRGRAELELYGPPPSERIRECVRSEIRRMLRLDEDLGPFYEMVAGDPQLGWVTTGAGRLVRSQSVFEDLVKTICTTNCAWSATVRMTGALVDHLGEAAIGAGGIPRRAFPSPQAMADAPEDFYPSVVRAGYRGPYLRKLARLVTDGSVDVEAWADAGHLTDADIEAQLLALPGVGPYAAAHMMLLLGRYSYLIFDSWTRPKYARMTGRAASDATIEKRFQRYGRFKGLAFWLYITRDWIDE